MVYLILEKLLAGLVVGGLAAWALTSAADTAVTALRLVVLP
jgi:hypothetical protein